MHHSFVMHCAALGRISNHTDASALVVFRQVQHWHWCGFLTLLSRSQTLKFALLFLQLKP